jgi:dTDP-4-amino-4,6-dideoxygalactose transaminase
MVPIAPPTIDDNGLAHQRTMSLTAPAAFPHKHAWNLFPIVLGERLATSHGQIVQAMRAKGIDIGTHYPAVHPFSFYRQQYGYRDGVLPEAERIGAHIITLPIYPSLSAADQHRVIEALNGVLDAA